MPALPNTKREAFCREYLIDFNAAAAARRAGYAEKNAGRQGHELLQIQIVHLRIKELTEARNERTDITADRVLDELAKVGFANISDYVRADKGGYVSIDLTKTTVEEFAALGEITVEEFMDGRGEDAREVRKVKLKMIDKLRALDKIGMHIGMWKSPATEAVDAFAAAMNEIRERGSTAPIADPTKSAEAAQ